MFENDKSEVYFRIREGNQECTVTYRIPETSEDELTSDLLKDLFDQVVGGAGFSQF